MTTKSLPPEYNAAARAFLQRYVNAQHKGNGSEAAKRLGVSQSMISDVIGGRKGVGMKLLDALTRETRASVDEILGRVPIQPQMSPRDLALKYMGDAITPAAIEILDREIEERQLDTSRWLPLRWGTEMTRIQRALLEGTGADLPPPPGSGAPHRPVPPPAPANRHSEASAHTKRRRAG